MTFLYLINPTQALTLLLTLGPLVSLFFTFLPFKTFPGFRISVLILANLTGFVALGIGFQGAETIVLPFLSLPNNIQIPLSFQLDAVGLCFAAVACGFTSLIQVYGLAYFKPTENQGYFLVVLSVFQSAMVILFLSNALFTLVLGWEGVGLCSYLLVQFWYQKTEVKDAAFRVAMINKLGDVFLISGIGLLFSFGLTSPVFFNQIYPAGSEIFLQSATGQVLLLFLVLAAFVKSAQFPFSIWLKEAMAGPTPVSALLHSATMVLAGVWLLVRLYPMLPPSVTGFLAIVGAFTYIWANISALRSSYWKSGLAFSTMAQLGCMVLAIGIGNPSGALLHGFVHAFFKAGLFLLCGWAMHEAEKVGHHRTDAQFFPNLQGLFADNQWLRWLLIFFLAGLAGIPGTAGYISKEAIFPAHPHFSLNSGIFWFWLAHQAGMGLTAAYAIRWGLVLAQKRSSQFSGQKLPWKMAIPLVLLLAGTGFWLIGPSPFSTSGWVSHFWGFKGVAVLEIPWAAVLGSGLAVFWYFKMHWKFQSSSPLWAKWIFDFAWFPPLFQGIGKASLGLARVGILVERSAFDRPIGFVANATLVGGYFSAFFDRFVVDSLIHGLVSMTKEAGHFFRIHSRRYAQYVVWFALTILMLMLYFVYR